MAARTVAAVKRHLMQTAGIAMVPDQTSSGRGRFSEARWEDMCCVKIWRWKGGAMVRCGVHWPLEDALGSAQFAD